jgi:hypothetical protein
MDLATTSNFDVKSFRDQMVARKALRDQRRTNSATAISNLRRIMENMDEESKVKLRDRGVDVSVLFNYDLEKVPTDKTYHQAFISDFSRILGEIERFMESESGD